MSHAACGRSMQSDFLRDSGERGFVCLNFIKLVNACCVFNQSHVTFWRGVGFLRYPICVWDATACSLLKSNFVFSLRKAEGNNCRSGQTNSSLYMDTVPPLHFSRQSHWSKHSLNPLSIAPVPFSIVPDRLRSALSSVELAKLRLRRVTNFCTSLVSLWSLQIPSLLHRGSLSNKNAHQI